MTDLTTPSRKPEDQAGAPFWLAVRGQKLIVTLHGHSWDFDFGDGLHLNVECSWRIRDNCAVKATSQDHGQQFGLSEPFDAQMVARSALQGSHVATISVKDVTADIEIQMDNGLIIDVTTNSTCFENWQAIGTGKVVVGHTGQKK